MWVEVMSVASDPADRSRHRVELRNGSLRLQVGWPGPLPHVGAVRVIELTCDDLVVLGRNAVLAGEGGDRPASDGAMEGVVLNAVLEQRFDEGTGRFLFGDGGSIVLDLHPDDGDGDPAIWRTGAAYALTLTGIDAFDTRIN